MLHAVGQLAEDVGRNILGCLGDEEDAHTLGTNEPDGGGDGFQEGLGCAVEQQVRLVKEEDELGLVQVTGFGQVLEESARSHMRNVENSSGLVCSVGSSKQLMTPRPSGAVRRSSAVSNSGSPKNFSMPCASSVTSSRRITPAVALDSPPRFASSALLRPR